MNSNFDIVKAIDFCDSAFVFIDAQFSVQYFNFKAFEMFRDHESIFQTFNPDFCYYKISHNNFDCLTQLLADQHKLDEFHQLQLGKNIIFYHDFGTTALKFKITPIIENEQRTGSCIELSDVTATYETKRQFDNAIQAGNHGDFSYRIDTTQLNKVHPLFHSVYDQVNALFGNLSHFVNDLSIALEHISHGNLAYCSKELALLPEPRQEQLNCSECSHFQNCLKTNYINPKEKYHEDNYLHTIKRDVHYTFQNLWQFIIQIQNNQITLEQSIQKIVNSYSEVAMTTETEYIKAQDIQQLIDDRLVSLKNINHEIDQATYIRDITTSNDEIIPNLKKSLQVVGEQINHISHIAQTLDNIFSHHVEGLQKGLGEIKRGNIGKGIQHINEQSNEIITKSRYAMSQIREAIVQMNSSFNSNSSINDIIDSVVHKIQSMNGEIDLLVILLSSIQQAVQSQEQTSIELKNFIQDIQNLLANTVGQIESMIYATSDLVSVHLALKQATQAFSLKENIPLDETYFEKNCHDDTDAIHVQLWK